MSQKSWLPDDVLVRTCEVWVPSDLTPFEQDIEAHFLAKSLLNFVPTTEALEFVPLPAKATAQKNQNEGKEKWLLAVVEKTAFHSALPANARTINWKYGDLALQFKPSRAERHAIQKRRFYLLTLFLFTIACSSLFFFDQKQQTRLGALQTSVQQLELQNPPLSQTAQKASTSSGEQIEAKQRVIRKNNSTLILNHLDRTTEALPEHLVFSTLQNDGSSLQIEGRANTAGQITSLLRRIPADDIKMSANSESEAPDSSVHFRLGIDKIP